MTPDLHLRSYDRVHWGDRHDFAQLVLPVHGEVVLDIEERRGRLDPLHGALVAPGAWHAQSSPGANESLIVDLDRAAFAGGPWQRLLERPFVTLAPAARKLVEFMGLMVGETVPHRAPPRSLVQGWVPLLLDTLSLDAPRPMSRLAALMARIEATPGLAWTTASMAHAANLSVSRLHAVFRQELDTTPHGWLLGCRLDCARSLLTHSARSVADIALACGFSDQASLTRAMRRTLDTTPAAYRRVNASRESATKA